MKKIILLLAVTTLFISSCSKTSTPPGNNGNNNNNNNNNGGNNNNNNNAGDITITSISPTNPYPDDEITITGTGFNADATKDTVEFGRVMGAGFGAWHDGLESEYASLTTIVSASPTQLVIKAVNTFVLDYDAFSSSTSSIAVMQVRTGGKKAVSPLIPFKRLLLLGYIENPDYFGDAIGRPSDSLIFGGKGFRTQGMKVSIDGTQVTDLKIDSTPNGSKISTRLPKTFFGQENDETLQAEKKVTITNPDGKTVEKNFVFLLSPQMHISSIYAETNTYSLGGLSSGGGVVKVFVSGRNLKNDAIVKVDGVTIHTQAGLSVNNFPDQTEIDLSAGSLAVGNLQVSIWRGNTLYGACSFKVNN